MATYTIKDLCERFSVGERSVILWIHQGDLKAIDVSRRHGGRPQWRVTEESLRAFLEARSSVAPPPKRIKRRKPTDVIEFYK